MLIVQLGSCTTYALHREYFLTDAQGSTFAVLTDWGDPVNTNASMSFDPFGVRRNPMNAYVAPWTPSLQQDLDNSSRHGYTGHEEVESIGVIHMNGRLYDPVIGRFMQPDPFVQDPLNSQSLNRFSYVLNNPMAHTDPTGYFSLAELIRDAVAIFIAYETAGVANGLWAEEAGGKPPQSHSRADLHRALCKRVQAVAHFKAALHPLFSWALMLHSKSTGRWI